MACYVAMFLLCCQKNAINVYMVPMLYSKQLATVYMKIGLKLPFLWDIYNLG